MEQTTAVTATKNTSCEDVQLLLQKLRVIDDKIMYVLNLATPSESFQEKVKPSERCEQVFHSLAANYNERGNLVQRCLDSSTIQLTSLRTVDPTSDPKLDTKIKEEKTKIRELRNELSIEEILRERVKKVFGEKCRQHYRGYEGW